MPVAGVVNGGHVRTAVGLRRTVRHLVIVTLRLAMGVRIGRMRRAVAGGDAGRGVARRFPGGAAIAAEERHRHQPEHVERGHERRNHGHDPHRFVCQKGAEQDLVLAEEAG